MKIRTILFTADLHVNIDAVSVRGRDILDELKETENVRSGCSRDRRGSFDSSQGSDSHSVDTQGRWGSSLSSAVTLAIMILGQEASWEGFSSS